MKEFLDKCSEAYYAGNPLISDAAFDILCADCHYDPVGYMDGDVPHEFQMYSLQKVYEGDTPVQLSSSVVSPKLDGAAVALYYVEGHFAYALTRGDGKKGKDITENMRMLDFPKRIGVSNRFFQVTGEVVAPKSIKNARNYAAGALGLKDPQEFAERDLTFIAYGLQPYVLDSFWSEDMLNLKMQGFNTVIDSDWGQFPHDGLVFREDYYQDFDSKGYTAHHPRGTYAFKEKQEGVVTKLVDVVWQVGKSGVVAPVGILEPIKIGDATVSRATLHNMKYIEDLGLELGCKVEIIRSGEIIPRVVRRV
jgi:DNA ligase (NAD+)